MVITYKQLLLIRMSFGSNWIQLCNTWLYDGILDNWFAMCIFIDENCIPSQKPWITIYKIIDPGTCELVYLSFCAME